jgi:hypothetical protein
VGVDPGGDERVVLIGKPGCHLCDAAREVVASVCAEHRVAWREESILGRPDLAARYHEFIPVVLVDGVEHATWRVSAQALSRALMSSP